MSVIWWQDTYYSPQVYRNIPRVGSRSQHQQKSELFLFAHWLPAHLKMTPGIPSILFLIPIEVGRKTEKKTKAFPVPGNLSIFEGCPKKPQEDFPIQLIAQSRQMTNSTYKKVSWEMIWWFLSSPEKKMKNCCIWCHATIPPTSVQW